MTEELERALEHGSSLGGLQSLKRYQRRRKPQNLAMMAAMEGFKRLFESDKLPLRLLRNDGMALFNGAGPLKKQLIRQAMGLT